MLHPGYLYPNFILSFENPISPYLWNQPESRLPRLHRLSLMTTTAVILRNCVHKRLPEADYKRAKLISTPLKVILSWQVAQKSDEHQSYISNGINRPTNTEVTILSEFKYVNVFFPLLLYSASFKGSEQLFLYLPRGFSKLISVININTDKNVDSDKSNFSKRGFRLQTREFRHA